MLYNLAVILPVHPTHRDRLDLFRAAVLLKSITLMGTIDELKEIIIIVPDNTVVAAEGLKRIVDNRVNLRVVSELSIFTSAEITAMSGRSGWLRQQFIKIAATRITDCEWLLMLDSDIINLRKLNLAELSVTGRIPTQFGTQFEAWKQGSAKVLSTTPPSNTMSVTPAILSRELLVLLQEELTDEKSGWVERLCYSAEQGIEWTEYMLYQCMGEKLGIFEKLHEQSSVILHRGFWRNTKATYEYIEELKKLSPMFLVVQSIRDDYDALQKVLSENEYPSVYLLNANDIVGLASGLFKCMREQKIFNKYHQLRLALEDIFEQDSVVEATPDDVKNHLNEVVARDRLKGKNIFNTLIEALAKDDDAKIINILHAVCLPREVKSGLLKYYYKYLLKQGLFVTLVSDILTRLQDKSLSECLLHFSLTEIINSGYGHWAAIIAYEARSNYSIRELELNPTHFVNPISI